MLFYDKKFVIHIFERIEKLEIKMSLGVKRKEGKRKSYVIFETDTVTRGLKNGKIM